MILNFSSPIAPLIIKKGHVEEQSLDHIVYALSSTSLNLGFPKFFSFIN